MEIRSIIEEYEMQAMGGLMAARELWEKALIPSLLSGAGTWLGECKDAISLCDQLQNFFWRVILYQSLARRWLSNQRLEC